ncbi:right-handed parallel beta-helix repeat-containing protein [Alteromonas sediminis]|nr:right-handed parallel beta-helix repeat-containing protein [Alteromonas sediminis]
MLKTIVCITLMSFSLAASFAGTVNKVPLSVDAATKPIIPDYTVYTPDAVREKITLPQRQATVSIDRLEASREYLRSVYSRNFLMFANIQKQLPRGIFIDGGRITLTALSEQLPRLVKRLDSGMFVARLPIIIEADAALLIEPGDTLRLSAERGAFIHSNGKLVVDSARVEGWLESTNSYSVYSGDEKAFRPFIQSYGGSETFLINAKFTSLGHDSGGSYGISLKSASPKLLTKLSGAERQQTAKPPTGYIVDSEFNDLYFGFYSFGAKDVVIVGNRYNNNIIYGIDPHDYSVNLLIADNTVVGTQRHGIIVSRHVNDSFIVHNVSKNNARTGIMVERESRNNVVAFNETYNNQGDGITIYESPNNLVFGNRVYDNADHGIRVRNSTDIKLHHNIVLNNRGAGVYFHVRDLSYQTERDLNIDPYRMESSGEVIGGLIAYNNSGGIFSEKALSLTLAQLRLESNGSRPFRGDLEQHYAAIKVTTWDSQNAAQVVFEHQQAGDNENP